ncbi:MAG: GNAT family N-acetyltransferase [Nitrospirota bacterium]
MIKELPWDSIFFKRKIGELKITSSNKKHIESLIENAKANGFKYIICKLSLPQTTHIRLLESLGFYLSDIGVTLKLETEKFRYQKKGKNSLTESQVRVANEKDIPKLKKMSKSLFTGSRFYSDPFFTKKEADSLFQTWVENSVTGKAADMVLHIPDKGYITCRKNKRDKGDIVLIGVRKGFRDKGIGSILMEEAIKWFKTKDVSSVSVRTQLKNINALEFYFKLGFHIKNCDLIFAKIL